MAIRKRGNSLQIDVQLTRCGWKVRHREAFRGSYEDALVRQEVIKSALGRGEAPSLAVRPQWRSGAHKQAWKAELARLAASPQLWPVGNANSPSRRRQPAHGFRSGARFGEKSTDCSGTLWPFASNRHSAQHGLTLSEALRDCYQRRWQGAGNEALMLGYMERLMAFYGASTPLGDIETDDIDTYIVAMRAAGLSPQTIRQRISPLSVAFNDFIGTRRGEGLQRPKFRFPKKQETLRLRVLSDREREKIIRLFWDYYDQEASRSRPEDAPCGGSWADYFTLLMDTGIRPGEARALRTSDLSNDRLRVWKTKSGKPRIIPLTARASEAFQRQAYRCEGPTNQPFTWATKDRVSSAWRWLRYSMGLEHDREFIPYILRHDCATRLYAKTSDLLLVKEWMGHSTIEMTLRYAKLDPRRLDLARDLLDVPGEGPHLRLV